MLLWYARRQAALLAIVESTVSLSTLLCARTDTVEPETCRLARQRYFKEAYIAVLRLLWCSLPFLPYHIISKTETRSCSENDELLSPLHTGWLASKEAHLGGYLQANLTADILARKVGKKNEVP